MTPEDARQHSRLMARIAYLGIAFQRLYCILFSSVYVVLITLQVYSSDGRETIMISIIFMVAIVAGIGWLVWRRWHDWRTPIRPQLSAERSPQTRAFEAFA